MAYNVTDGISVNYDDGAVDQHGVTFVERDGDNVYITTGVVDSLESIAISLSPAKAQQLAALILTAALEV